MKNPLSFKLFSLIGNASFLSGYFQCFFFTFSFLKFMMYLAWIFWVNYPVWHLLSFWICRLMPFAKFGKFATIISCNTFSAISSVSSPPGPPVAWRLDVLLYSRLLRLCSSIVSLFFLCCSNLIISIVLSLVHWLFPLLSLFYYWAWSGSVSFWLWYFSALKFSFGYSLPILISLLNLSVSLWRISSFSLILTTSISSHQNILMMSALKSLSVISRIFVISAFASIDRHFSFILILSQFLVWCVIFNWNLDIWGIMM